MDFFQALVNFMLSATLFYLWGNMFLIQWNNWNYSKSQVNPESEDENESEDNGPLVWFH
jgi:hypothetical protein